MMAMAVSRSARKTKNDDVWPESADVPDDVAQDLFSWPLSERFLGGFGESEIDRAGEKLLATIDAAGGEQLLGANEAHLRTLFTADQVLSAFAASERTVGRAHVPPAREISQHRRAFVIGMRCDVQYGSEFVQLVERLFNLGRAGKWPLRRERRDRHDTQKKRDRKVSHVSTF